MDLDFYAKRDGVWRELGLAAPARRALVNADLLTIKSLTTITRDDLAKLHGMGPSALKVLDRMLAAKGLNYRRN